MATTQVHNGTTVVLHDAGSELPRSLSTWIIGRALPTAEAPHQTIGKRIGLAVFASDALSSTAYATQEILVVLAYAGVAAFSLSVPIAVAIVVLLAIVTVSYRQTIHAYPGGGGAYIVARDNLGELPAQTAGAALLTDYVLTVAVSISSGVAQIVSAYPSIAPYRVPLAVGLILFVMLINLRGVKESGATFALPTYFFIVIMYVTVGLGLARAAMGNLAAVAAPPAVDALHGTQTVTLFLILRAFAGGTTTLTGVEAISNGIRAFKEPRSHNAGVTLVLMSSILGSLLLAITWLAFHINAIPSEQETIISQLARTVYDGRGPLYLAAIAGTTVILIMAANTSFADFPRLGALHAGDGFLPRQLTYLGSRLVFSRGIITLAVLSSALVVLFRASVTALIPLYAIGVFLSFTLSQAGMARRWWKAGRLARDAEVQERGSVLRYERGWRGKMIVNALGSAATAVVMVVFAVTKFREGAWVVVVLIPALVFTFFRIHAHYHALAKQLSMEGYSGPPAVRRHRVLLAISGVHQGTMNALRYAHSLGNDVTAVHVCTDPVEGQRIREKWELWGDGTRLVLLDSPYRLMLDPLLSYIGELDRLRRPGEFLTVIVPEFVPSRRIHGILHMNTADILRRALLRRPGLVIIDVPYQVT